MRHAVLMKTCTSSLYQISEQRLFTRFIVLNNKKSIKNGKNKPVWPVQYGFRII